MLFAGIYLQKKPSPWETTQARRYKATWISLKPDRFFLFLDDACRPAPWVDALIIQRALSEHSELVRSPSRVRPIFCGRTGRHWFWVLLPKQKGLGCRAETRHHQNHIDSIIGKPHSTCSILSMGVSRGKPRWIPDKTCRE